MNITSKQARMKNHQRSHAIRRSDGLWYCVDDSGRVVWDREWHRLESDEAHMRSVIACYAASVRRKLRLVQVDGLRTIDVVTDVSGAAGIGTGT